MMLNYCTKAREYLKGIMNSPYIQDEGNKVIVPAIDGFMDEAQKFLLPQYGTIFDEGKYIQWENVPLNLPFPIVALEYESPFKQEEGEGVPVPQRIALAIQSDKLGLYPEFQNLINTFLKAGNKNRTDIIKEFLLIWPVYGFGNGIWLPSWCGALLPPGTEGLDYVDPAQYEWMGAKAPSAPRMSKTFIPAVNPTVFIRQIEEGHEPEFIFKNMLTDLGDEIRSVKQLCQVLSCENIETIQSHPSTFLNKARKKKRKIPLYSYHILNLTQTHYEKSPDLGGTHASPRFHFRRGHIRILSESKKVWVRSCTVGQGPGIVDKDYQVDRKK